MGELRFDLWAVLRIVFLRHYRARFSYLPPPADGTTAAAEDDDGTSLLPELSEDIKSADWKTVEDEFVVFWASNMSHAASTTLQSPSSRLQDGIFNVLLIRKGSLSRIGMLKFLLAVSTGKHLSIPGVESVQCRAFRLVPSTSGSFNDIDGEVVEDGPIQAEVLPSRMRTFGKNCRR